MKYIWIIMLIIIDLFWIFISAIDIYKTWKINKHYYEVNEYPGLLKIIGDTIDEVEPFTAACIITNLLAIFGYSLVLFIIGLE